jgi:L-glyceraldehyde 3-phosphate reductase
VDIFYHHRPDPQTPLAETMAALDHAVRSGRALYVGLSNYPAALLREASALLRQLGTPCVIHQPRYSLLDRHIEDDGLLEALAQEGIGCIAYSPLAQGLLSGRYLDGVIPADSRAARGQFLKAEHLTAERLAIVRRLAALARERGQSLAQLALAWVLRHAGMSSVLIGASRVAQVDEAVAVPSQPALRDDELRAIADILASPPGG